MMKLVLIMVLANGVLSSPTNHIPTTGDLTTFEPDVQDHSENVDEIETTCPADKFTCTNGKCITSSWICDTQYDCNDKSDEVNCHLKVTCADDMFTCATGQCMPPFWRCDNETDCSDGSDELNCHLITCADDMFRCATGQCIRSSWRCDFEPDCSDESDELNCPSNCTGENQLKCNNNKCIGRHNQCDGDDDCGDMTDESGCRPCEYEGSIYDHEKSIKVNSTYECGTCKCINGHMRCVGCGIRTCDNGESPVPAPGECCPTICPDEDEMMTTTELPRHPEMNDMPDFERNMEHEDEYEEETLPMVPVFPYNKRKV